MKHVIHASAGAISIRMKSALSIRIERVSSRQRSPCHDALFAAYSAFHKPLQNGLLHMQAVLGLDEDPGVRSIEYVVRHFLTAMSWQWVKEDALL